MSEKNPYRWFKSAATEVIQPEGLSLRLSQVPQEFPSASKRAITLYLYTTLEINFW